MTDHVIRLVRKHQEYEAIWFMNETVAADILEWISSKGGTSSYMPEKSTRSGGLVPGYFEILTDSGVVEELDYNDWIVWNDKDKFGFYSSEELEEKFKQVLPEVPETTNWKSTKIGEAVDKADSFYEAAGLVVGMASTCWVGFFDNPPDLVFDEAQAKAGVDALVGYYHSVLRDIQNGHPHVVNNFTYLVEDLQPYLGLATTQQLLDELTARIDTDYASGGGGLGYTSVYGRPDLLPPAVKKPFGDGEGLFE